MDDGVEGEGVLSVASVVQQPVQLAAVVDLVAHGLCDVYFSPASRTALCSAARSAGDEWLVV